jgi:hypothetical protein
MDEGDKGRIIVGVFGSIELSRIHTRFFVL